MRPHTTVSLLLLLLLLTAVASTARATPARFAIVGSGVIKIRSTKTPVRFSGRYRHRNGRYNKRALHRINRVFGTSYERREARISLRFIERLAFLRDTLRQRGKTNWIIISSGYRSPDYNKMLRDKGRTVAKASLHQYGMAADIRITGIPAKRLWRVARQHRIGGAGYYGGKWVHVDTGPVRSWTQGSANVRKGISDHNKRIILIPEYDRYAVGELLWARFARMTAYPIGVSRRATLERADANGSFVKQRTIWPRLRAGKQQPRSGARGQRPCVLFEDHASMSRVRWRVPRDLELGRYRLRVRFCKVNYEAMPKTLSSYEVTVGVGN